MSHSVAVAKELLASIRRDEHVARQTAYRARKRRTTSLTVGDKLLLCLVWQLCLSAQVLVTVCRGRLRHVAEAAPCLQPYSLGQWLKEIIDRHLSDHDIAPFCCTDQLLECFCERRSWLPKLALFYGSCKLTCVVWLPLRSNWHLFSAEAGLFRVAVPRASEYFCA